MMKDIFLKLTFNILKKRHWLHKNVSFLPKRMNIEKVERLVANSHDETEYVIHIRNLKKALNNGLVLEKVYRVIKSNQNAWLKPYIDMNTDLKKIIFKKHFLSW